jgi:hypothetical protein
LKLQRLSLPHPLEPRTLFAVAPAPSPALDVAPTVHVTIDYSLDANHFFDTQQKRELLQQAADSVVKWFRDELLSIVPGGGDTWDAVLDDPATGQERTIANPSIAANEVLLFAGGRDMSDALGRGGPGGFRARGSTGWPDRVARRGQSSSGGPEFGPWGGAITFDTNPTSPWHFGTDTTGLGGSNDFLSVATHEVSHVFGFGTSDSWSGRVAAGKFAGPRSVALYDGAGDVPLSGDEAHWADGTRDDGREVAMDPQLTTGTRRLLTPLDYAGLDDVGWSLPPHVTPSLPLVNRPGATGQEVVVRYSHYAKIDTTTFQQPGDVFAITPGGVVVDAVYSRMSVSTDGTSADVTYAIAPPGGTWDATDNGTWPLVLSSGAVLSTSGEGVAGGTLGSFTVDVADAPVGTLQPPAAPAGGSASQTLAVVYTDAVAVDPATTDVNDVLVSAPDGSPVTVTGAAVDSAAPGTPRVATYTIAAPGGSWGPEDDGVYSVSLRAGEVSDTSGNGSAQALTGTFEVSVGAMPFDAGRPAVYTDASGDVVKVSLKGPGAGRLRFTAARPADAVAIELAGTTVLSTLTVKCGPAGTGVGDVAVTGSLKSLAAKNLDVTGDVTATESLGAVRLRTAGAGGAVSAVTIGKLKLVSLASDVRATGAIGTITAASITGAHVFAGVRPDLADDLPDALDDFANPAASIRAVTAKASTSTFVAAPAVGKVSFGIATAVGVAGDRITSLTGRPGVGQPAFKAKNLDLPGSAPVIPGVDLRVL